MMGTEDFERRGLSRKTAYNSEVPISSDLAAILERYAPSPPAGPVLHGRRGGPLDPVAMWRWCRMVCEEAGFPGVSTHVLRHTALATAHDTSGDLRATQALAGHADVRTTQIYTRSTEAALLRAAEALSAAYRDEAA